MGVVHRRVTKRHANDAECHATQRMDCGAYGQAKHTSVGVAGLRQILDANALRASLLGL